MKALVYEQYGTPDVLRVKEMPTPTIKDNQVLIEVQASGINPVDTYFRKGIREVPSFPHIPHFDVAGTIIEVGGNVTSHSIGDRVWASNAKGASGEYVALDAELAFPLTDSLSFADGAALSMPFLTAHLALFFRGQLKSDETVLIYGGSGAVGYAAIQLAKEAGATVITTASSTEKAQIAKAAGADHVILYKETTITKKVLELTDGAGVPLILEMSLSDNMETDFEIIENGGRIITIGSPNDNTPPLLWRQLNQKNAALLGLLLFTVPKEAYIAAGQQISKLFHEQKLQTHNHQVFTLEDAVMAHQAVEAKEINGRAILIHK
ncbi:quinone oxidoreductase [Alkalihalobacillus alcalophilus ATCC 27647 = CGMCC 1.3604]|uniref:Quinone oxidoreductase n=1 Tax=Alkalihalobacillus alcalophilus ATCC 27647 = CGMCC 1.3604 TaxID=1218173 RepID=A0A4S4K0Z8_ALKAL|nr:NADPH:quinone reductase [Alkalihalobacillus alcalophilus]MED1562565.1 NADPH:quinone reductase [Alkalihalobacillus alcalophilus]THG91278.1 quinone oxidoreductase [Alkalihalobacillus alcalophilus ATCC 27647 = CGMCC 1.3604]